MESPQSIDDHLSRMPIARHLKQPTRKSNGAGSTVSLHRSARSFLLGLAPSGVYQADWVTPVAGELLPHRFTLTRRPVT